jgi:hypothetical protein
MKPVLQEAAPQSSTPILILSLPPPFFHRRAEQNYHLHLGHYKQVRPYHWNCGLQRIYTIHLTDYLIRPPLSFTQLNTTTDKHSWDWYLWCSY